MSKYVETNEPAPVTSGSRSGKGGRKGGSGRGGGRGGGRDPEAEPADVSMGSGEQGSRKRPLAKKGLNNAEIMKKIKLLQARKGKGKGVEEAGNILTDAADAESVDSKDD